MAVFLKAGFCVCYMVPLGFVVLMRNFILGEHFSGASHDEKSGWGAASYRFPFQCMDKFDSTFWSETPFYIHMPIIQLVLKCSLTGRSLGSHPGIPFSKISGFLF